MDFLNNKSSRNQENIDKLPFFLNNSGSPKSWFQLLEAKYDFSAMSSSNKFYQAVAGLPPDVLKLLADGLVEGSISCNPYNYLKDLVIEHYKTKPNEIISAYFANNSIEEMKPSKFLEKAIRELESQHPGITKDNDQKLRQLFMSGLPSEVQKIVDGISNIELTKLADFADKIYEKQLMKSNGTPDDKLSVCILTAEISSLKTQVQALQEKFAQLERKVNQKSKKTRQKSPSLKPTSRPSSPKNSCESKSNFNDKNSYEYKSSFNDKNSYEYKSNFNDKISYDSKSNLNDKTNQWDLCYYHLKYGSGAQKCQLGCDFQPRPYGLKMSNICIYHARNSADSSHCVPGCMHYSSYNGQSSR